MAPVDSRRHSAAAVAADEEDLQIRCLVVGSGLPFGALRLMVVVESACRSHWTATTFDLAAMNYIFPKMGLFKAGFGRYETLGVSNQPVIATHKSGAPRQSGDVAITVRYLLF